MTVSTVDYQLQHGYIDYWLAAGPQDIPLDFEGTFSDQDLTKSITSNFQTTRYEFPTPPVERGPVNEGTFTLGDYKGEWNFYSCNVDHLVNLSAQFYTYAYVRAWAYTHLYWDADTTVQFKLATYGPVDVWLNKKHIFQASDFPAQLETVEFDAQIKKGSNKLLIRFANLAAPNALLAISVKVTGSAGSGKVQIPTLIPSISRRNQLEAMYDQMYLERYIHAYNQQITLKFPQNLEQHAAVDVRLQTTSGRIYGQSEDRGQPGSDVQLSSSAMLPLTTYQVVVMPRAWEYYESQIRTVRRFNAWTVGRVRFSSKPYDHLDERKHEALVFATSVENTIFAEIAKIALGKWADLDEKLIKQTLADIQQRRSGSEMRLLGLLGVLSRFGKAAEMPAWLAEQIHETTLVFHYSDTQWLPSPARKAAWLDREIIYETCKILAGQLFPNDTFKTTDQSGNDLRAEGEKAALIWMEKRGLSGFACWDSKEIYTQIIASLSHLIDLSTNEAVWELASVLMDKMLFSIALNSFQGIYGSTQGYGSTTGILSGLLEPTSGITRIFWGMGIFNLHLEGTVCIACMNEYLLPPIIGEIAAGTLEEMLNKEQQATGEFPVNTVTYRTPHYMLSSAQSYRPGERGDREHIWQATLGPQAVVFVNHPGFAHMTDNQTPNYWLGNATLPRVVQLKNIVIAMYNNPEESGMDYTHAYFPAVDFDEYHLEGNTLFARNGEGYLALTALNGMELVRIGSTAFREIRSPGRQNTWICQMGSGLEDETFENFRTKIQSQRIQSDGNQMTIRMKIGDTIEFGWNTPLRYNGEDQAIAHYPHFDNPYTTSPMMSKEIVIANNDFRLGLNFGQEPGE